VGSGNGGSRNPLRESLAEQLVQMRGDDAPIPDALIDVVVDGASPGGEAISVLRPRDWDELRHQEGAVARTAPYWARLWPSGLALADALAARDDLAGRRVIELGCGLGLPSIVAARAGAEVLATDGSPDAVVFTAHNMALNDAEGEVALADWREADPLAERGPWDLVIAADVFYLRDNVEALMRLLPRLLSRDGSGEALIADPSRAGGREFLAAARGLFAVQTRADPERERVNVHSLRRRGRD
jgi:predicted nicotinamide N-methyase